jgi:molybdopterin molybdotransferase
MKLLSIEETQARVLEQINALPEETIPVAQAGQRYLASTLNASLPLPSFDNSSMDGYAVRASEACSGASLVVAGEQPAGPTQNLTLPASGAIRIFTGAPLPHGADAVVMQEDCRRQADRITILEGVVAGENIRLRGSDLTEGQQIGRPGQPLTPARVALLASHGHAEVRVFRRPRFAVIATGSELRTPGEPLRMGEIYESNRFLIAEMVRQAGAEPAIFDVVPDDEDRTIAALETAAQYDGIVLSGGMSVGEHDYVKSALTRLGAQIELWRVAIKPGKPFLFGRVRRQPFFGLPGNPVSAFVTFFFFVRPAILKMAGSRLLEPPTGRATLSVPILNDGDRPLFVRGQLEGSVFHAMGNQASHALYGLSLANALARVDPGQRFEAGQEVSVILLEAFGSATKDT